MTGIHMRAGQGYSDGMIAPAPRTANPTSDKPPRPRRWILVSLCIFGGILVVVSGAAVLLVTWAVIAWFTPSTPSAATAEQVSHFGDRVGIAFPVAATPVAYMETRGMDDSLWLQMQMSTSDLQEFLATPPLDEVNLSDEKNEIVLHAFHQFWTSPPSRYRSAQIQLPNARVLNILIDETDSEKVIVYVQWHET